MSLTKTFGSKRPAVDLSFTVVSCSRISYQWNHLRNFELLQHRSSYYTPSPAATFTVGMWACDLFRNKTMMCKCVGSEWSKRFCADRPIAAPAFIFCHPTYHPIHHIIQSTFTSSNQPFMCIYIYQLYTAFHAYTSLIYHPLPWQQWSR